MPVAQKPARRRGEAGRFPKLVHSSAARLDPVTGGRCLLVFTGAAVALGAVMLAPSEADWGRLLDVSVAMLSLVALSFAVPWARLPRYATMAFPMTTFVGFAILGSLVPGLTTPLSGLLVAAYLYTGLTQRPGSSAWVIPLGCVTFVLMNGGLSDAVTVRLIIGVFVWTTLVEVLAAFTARQRRLAAALTTAAHQDVLTGIANRRDLEMRLATLQPGDAVVLCDLDHFKALNDGHGHAAGDRTLSDFGGLLRLYLRGGDYCARFGGEEFVLILPDTDPSAASSVVDRLREAWRLMGAPPTFSAGIAACRPGRDPAATLAAADTALYAAKEGGRNTTRVDAGSLATQRRGSAGRDDTN